MVKVKFDFSADLWIKGVVIEAESEEAAKEQLLGMSISTLMEQVAESQYDESGYIEDGNISDISTEIISRDYKVAVKNIVYDLEDIEFWMSKKGITDPDKQKELINNFPTTAEFTATDVEDEDSIEGLVEDHLTELVNYITEPVSFDFTHSPVGTK